jgi:hypothetical protein
MQNNIRQLLLHSALLAVLIGIMSSCALEKKYAVNYVKKVQADSVPVFFIGADYLFKTNAWLVNEERLPDDEFQALGIEKSAVIGEVNDSVIIENYNTGFQNALKALGYKVYSGDQLNDFLSLEKQGFIISITQLELEEDTFTKYLADEIAGELYYEKFELKQVNCNSWVEISKVNDTAEDVEVYFNSDALFDKVDGYFFQDVKDKNQVKVKYTKYIVKPSLAEKSTLIFGRAHMENIFDLQMNEYVLTRLPEYNAQYIDYYHFDPKSKKLLKANRDDGAVRMK